MRKYINKITAGLAIIIVLAFVFWYGGNAPGLRGWTPQPTENVNTVTENTSTESNSPTNTDKLSPPPSATVTTNEELEQKISKIPIKQKDESATEYNRPQAADNAPMTPAEKEALAERIANANNSFKVQNGSTAYSEASGMVIDASTGKDKYLTAPVPEGKPIPVEPQDSVITDKELSCTLSVRCDTILKNIAWLDKEKVDIVPKDGVIFAEKTVTFFEGESVFNLLLREMKQNKIHMEFENTPIYNSAYIEGIANLYEFDCGELSGWMYKVNDWFPNYGCSRYRLKAGDRIEWVYTCDLGVDVGGYYATKGE